MREHIIDTLEAQLRANPDTQELLTALETLKQKKLNILFVGATGVGKSSTINALFDMDDAKVGNSADPETASIQKYEADNLVLWDTPGFGDSPENDARYAKEVAYALKACDENGELLIDEVVVVIDGSSRDMGTAYAVIKNVIAPLIGDPKRIAIAINQCDMAKKGHDWNKEQGIPEPALVDFLDKQAASVQTRIAESTGLWTKPVYYSALYHYNISKLLLTMLTNLPEGKRFLFTDSMNREPSIWEKNDSEQDYNQEIEETILDPLSKAIDSAVKGAEAGAKLGEKIPVIGPILGAIVGGAFGFLSGFLH